MPQSTQGQYHLNTLSSFPLTLPPCYPPSLRFYDPVILPSSLPFLSLHTGYRRLVFRHSNRSNLPRKLRSMDLLGVLWKGMDPFKRSRGVCGCSVGKSVSVLVCVCVWCLCVCVCVCMCICMYVCIHVRVCVDV